MRVVQLLSDTDRRGAQLFGVALGEHMAALGVDVVTRPLLPGRQANGLTLDPLGTGTVWLRTLPALRRLVRDADIVLAHGSTTLPAAALGVANCPFVYRSIGDLPQWAVTPRQRRTTSLALGRAAAVTVLWGAVGEALVRDFGVPASRVSVEPNAADHRRFVPALAAERREERAKYGIAPGHDVIVYLGALAPEKRVGDLLAAVDRRPNTTVLVAGDGPLREELTSTADRLETVDVRFLGAVADPAPLYRVADVVALTSATEGQPGVIIEAGLSGVASVCTDVGGVGELIDDGRSGRLVPVGEPEAVRVALDEVLAAPSDFAQHALDRCRDKFTLEAAAHRWLRLCENVVRGR